ncbi:uncharacterized protein H6S33_006353 [Morchella sextelata]|jgi:hypothetical protein|uniref:uncharacterized protein n=1 Tax=Morchella sextelata TaxID=1174677 RepID=UPI001D055098|nr:uncharacterized protein H6S33_006353 [Morchella sextelata]KAH0604685.1 hypothetical protein H6S33_006353 [Morchella sextelata]
MSAPLKHLYLDHLYLNFDILKKYQRNLLAHQKHLTENLACMARSASPTLTATKESLAAKLDKLEAQISHAEGKAVKLEKQISEALDAYKKSRDSGPQPESVP